MRQAHRRAGRQAARAAPARPARTPPVRLPPRQPQPHRDPRELLEALWPDGRDGGLAPLLSKLRRLAALDGLRLQLPRDAWIDVEAAAEAVHRAESAIAQDDFHRAWGPSQVAMFVAARPAARAIPFRKRRGGQGLLFHRDELDHWVEHQYERECWPA